MPHRPNFQLRRRNVLSILGAAALTPRVVRAATEPPLEYSGIDHVLFPAADLQKSITFYARIFGDTVFKDNTGPNHHVKLGPNYVTLVAPGQPNARGHFCLGIKNYQMMDVKGVLERAGIKSREVSGAGLITSDPDGIPIQLWTENAWGLLARTASPVSVLVNGEARIRPTQINHLLLAVSDTEKSASFYERILGAPFSRTTDPERVWFRVGRDRVGLSPLSGLTAQSKDQVNGEHITSGSQIGLDHVGLVAPFDREMLTKELVEAGARMLPQVLSGPDAAAIDFREVNGFRLQVTPPPKPRA